MSVSNKAVDEFACCKWPDCNVRDISTFRWK